MNGVLNGERWFFKDDKRHLKMSWNKKCPQVWLVWSTSAYYFADWSSLLWLFFLLLIASLRNTENNIFNMFYWKRENDILVLVHFSTLRLTADWRLPQVPRDFLLQILGEDRVTNFVIREIVTSTLADYVKKAS